MYGVLSICGNADRMRVEGSMSVDEGGFVEEIALLIKRLIPALKPSQKQVFERPVCAKGEHHRAQASGAGGNSIALRRPHTRSEVPGNSSCLLNRRISCDVVNPRVLVPHISRCGATRISGQLLVGLNHYQPLRPR